MVTYKEKQKNLTEYWYSIREIIFLMLVMITEGHEKNTAKGRQ